jgi:hypothetical protein
MVSQENEVEAWHLMENSSGFSGYAIVAIVSSLVKMASERLLYRCIVNEE